MDKDEGTGFLVTMHRIMSGYLSEIMWNDYMAFVLYMVGAIWLIISLYSDVKRYFKRRTKKRQGMSERDMASSRWEQHSRWSVSHRYIDPGILIAVAFLFRDWYALF